MSRRLITLRRICCVGLLLPLLLSGCAEPTAKAPDVASAPVAAAPERTASPPEGAPATQPGSPAVQAQADVPSNVPPQSRPTVAGTSTPPGPHDRSWVQPGKDPFDVRAFLAERVPQPNGPRQQAYLAGLRQLSGNWGDSGGQQLDTAIREAADIERMLAGDIAAQQVATILQSAQPALAEVRRAQTITKSSPYETVFPYDLRLDAELPNVAAATNVGRLIFLEAFRSRHLRQSDDTLAAVERNLQLSRDIQPRGVPVSQLVSMSIDNWACDAVTRLLLDEGLLNAEQCNQLITLLSRHQQESLPRYEEALKAEFINLMNTLHDFRAGKLDRETFWEVVAESPAERMPQQLDFDKESEAFRHTTTLALEEAQLPFHEVPQPSRFAAALEQLTQDVDAAVQQRDQSAKLPLMTIIRMPALEEIRIAHERSRVTVSGLQCQLAIRHYELTHGSLPTSLPAAIEETPLAQVPEDYFAGRPMSYTLSDGKAIVYSIGKDRQDDGGLVDWDYSRQPGDFLFPVKPLSTIATASNP